MPDIHNEWGWPLPATDHLLAAEMPYTPLDIPAHNIAERLVMLGHLTFNERGWSSNLDRYWEGYSERIEGAANVVDVAHWWCQLMEMMSGQPLRRAVLLHEKNLLVRPTALTPAVEDSAVLDTFRSYSRHLVDRTRMWVHHRRSLRTPPGDLDV